MRPHRRLGSLLLLALTVLCTLGFAVAVERQFGEHLAEVREPPPPRDPAGRRLYILMIDSLAEGDLSRMPRFEALGEQGFRMTIESCFDNFTTACVREMLTGRRSFSLFSALENFEVTQPGVGENLISDARDAGLDTAMLSWGDLKSWSRMVDTHRRFKDGDEDREAAIGLRIAAKHDLVFHHWIWHDVASHHYAKKNGEKYAESLRETDALIGAIADGLPPDMDLLVTGDHGHAPDGRHVQGMDLPTLLAARSPNLARMEAEGRPPSAAVRYVAGAVLGIGSHASWVEEAWRGWAAPQLGEALRGVGSGRETVDAEARFPTGPVAVALLLAVVAAGAMDWRAALALLAWAAAAGFVYPEWLEFSDNQGYRKPFLRLAWCPPLAGVALGWWRGRVAGAWQGAAAGGLALGLLLWPGLYFTSILRNTAAMASPTLIIGGGLALWWAVGAWRGGERRRPLVVPVVVAAAVTLFLMSTDFSSNHFTIRRLPVTWIFDDLKPFRRATSALLGVAILWLLDRNLRWIWLGGAAVLLGPVLPPALHAAAFIGLAAAFLSPSGPWRARAIGALALLITGYTLSTGRQLGALWTVLGVGLGFQVIQRGVEGLSSEAGVRAGRWAGAALLATGGLIGLAWTTKLKVSGVDFTFAIDWLPGRLHKQLWWVVLSATMLNCVLPLLLTYEIARSQLGERASEAAALAIRFSVLRVAATLIFTTTWIIAVGDRAPSIRLHSFLQDGFVWLLIGLTLAALSARSARPARS